MKEELPTITDKIFCKCSKEKYPKHDNEELEREEKYKVCIKTNICPTCVDFEKCPKSCWIYTLDKTKGIPTNWRLNTILFE